METTYKKDLDWYFFELKRNWKNTTYNIRRKFLSFLFNCDTNCICQHGINEYACHVCSAYSFLKGKDEKNY